MKQERIQEFLVSLFTEADEKVPATIQKQAEQFVHEIVSDKRQSSLEQPANGFSDDLGMERDAKQEDVVWTFKDGAIDCSIGFEFTWVYEKEIGRKSGDYDSPDDPDEVLLQNIDITSIDYYRDDTEPDGELDFTPTLLYLLHLWLYKNLPIDGLTRSYHRSFEQMKQKAS